mmetsp:Transcript_30892/g.51136  ORF Transcript_30892/g.51136 Transcript_30892/m.51136 type:complete len:107 (+) Transcript_30892:85-405(+)
MGELTSTTYNARTVQCELREFSRLYCARGCDYCSTYNRAMSILNTLIIMAAQLYYGPYNQRVIIKQQGDDEPSSDIASTASLPRTASSNAEPIFRPPDADGSTRCT